MVHYLKKQHAICYDIPDLKRIFEAPWRQWMESEIVRRGYSTEDLLLNGKERMHELVAEAQDLQGKEEIEIFFALYVFPRFYSEESQVCFPLNQNIDTRKTPINTLQQLKNSLRESDLTDFSIMSDNEYRQFQLKQYRGVTDSNDLLAFITQKLRHYGNNLGNVNMLVTLQSQGAIEGDFFGEIHRGLLAIGFPDTLCVLISYNEDDQFAVINTVHPTLGTTRIAKELTVTA